MFKGSLLLAIRNITKHKGYSLLNILGLAMGLSCFAFIACWVRDEVSYDTFHTKVDRIVRVASKSITPSETFNQAITAAPLAGALKIDFPEIDNTVRLVEKGAIAQVGDKQADESGILLTDPSFFDVFDYPLSVGDPKTALGAPYTIILTRSMAEKYFGKEDPIGKTITLYLFDGAGMGAAYTVTGIIPDAPGNTHFTFNFLVSFKTFESYSPQIAAAWDKNGIYTYLLLHTPSDIDKIAGRLPAFAKRHLPKDTQQTGTQLDFFLQPLTSIHLDSHLRYEIAPTGSRQDVYIFATIGLFVLLIAGINYINLATARASERARETGVQKVMGILKSHLIFQHLMESLTIAFIALALALVITWGLRPVFQQLSGKELLLFRSPGLLFFLIAVTGGLGILSGLYPAFLVARYRPVEVLKGRLAATSGGILLRRSLVVLQFTISIILMAGILVINRQLRYIQHKDLGYAKDALITLKVNGNTGVIRNYASFRNDLLSKQLVTGVATSNATLAGSMNNSEATTVSANGDNIHSIIYNFRADQNYFDVYEMSLAAGRNFDRNIITDSSSFLVNEAAVRSFGWKNTADALNKPFSSGETKGTIIGVIRDFHFTSLHERVEPLFITPRLQNQRFSQISVRISMTDPATAIDWVSRNWKNDFPGALLEYSFMDKRLGDQYLSEDRTSKFLLYFSLLSLGIACLGLFGLTSFTVHQRTREIGIRKILGAGVPDIAALLSKDFLKLILLAAVIALPIAWYVMNEWLQGFAYRITITWWILALAGTVAVTIAVITISFQAVRAAVANPVKSIRME